MPAYPHPAPDLLRRLRRATTADLAHLGAETNGALTTTGIVTLAAATPSPPPWAGFRVSTWPGALVDHPRLSAPTEVRRLHLPTVTYIDVLADEIAVLLGERLPNALFDSVREAAEELLVNAVAHRDYTIDAPIDVDLFTNAVRITSPGAPAHANVVDGAFVGAGARNPALQHLLRLLGRGRQQGMGWPQCLALASAAGLHLQASVDENSTVVTLAIAPPERVRVERTAQHGTERRLRLPGGTWDTRVLELLGDGEAWRPKDIQAALDIPRSTLTTVLRRLADQGHIEPSCIAARSSKQTWRRTQGSQSQETSMPAIPQASNRSSTDGSGPPSPSEDGGEG